MASPAQLTRLAELELSRLSNRWQVAAPIQIDVIGGIARSLPDSDSTYHGLGKQRLADGSAIEAPSALTLVGLARLARRAARAAKAIMQHLA